MYEGRDSEHRGRRVVALDFPRHSCRAAQRQAGHRIGVLGDHRDVPCRRGTQSSVQEVKRTRPCKQYPGSFVALLLLACCLFVSAREEERESGGIRAELRLFAN